MSSTGKQSTDKKPRVEKSAKAKLKVEEKSRPSPANLKSHLESWTANAHPDALEYKFKDEDSWNSASEPFKNIQKEMDDENTTPSRRKELSNQLERLCKDTFMPDSDSVSGRSRSTRKTKGNVKSSDVNKKE